jgi:hypothetical protein
LFCSVFVAHKDIDLENRPIPAWMYWKMEVESIRRDQETNRCWVLGLWYYTADQVAERSNFNKKYIFYLRA